MRLTKEGFLDRCSEQEALETLLARIMMRTPYGKWAGCQHFGLRDFFEDARAHPERIQQAKEEVNLTLQELGVRYRLESIVREPQPSRDVDAFSLTFTIDGEQEPVVLKF